MIHSFKLSAFSFQLSAFRLFPYLLICTSLILPGEEDPLHEADEIVERLAKRIDAVIDAGGQGFAPTTVVDLTGPEPLVTRVGCGPIEGRVQIAADED